MSDKVSASFRISDEAVQLAEKLAERHGLKIVPLLEMIVRKWHRADDHNGHVPEGFLRFMHRRGRKHPFARRVTQDALLLLMACGAHKSLSDADALEYMVWREAQEAGLSN